MGLSIEERQLVELRIRNDAPNVVVAYVLWGFLGLISAHRFYLGRPRSAILQILSLVTVVGWFVWWLFDAAMISAYIRDDKAALRDSLIDEIESEHRGGGPRLMPTPMPKAAMAPAAKVEPKAELVLDKQTQPPLTMGDAPKPAAAKAEPATNGKKGQPLTLGAEPAAVTPEPVLTASEPKPTVVETTAAEPEPVAQMVGLSEHAAPAAEPVMHEPEPALEPAPVIPHPEHIDASPIEVFPPNPQAQAVESLLARDNEVTVGEPLRMDRQP